MSVTRKSDLLTVGDTYTVRGNGEHGGEQAKVLDKTPFPDTDLERRRKITVEINGERCYILPRLLEVETYQTPSQQAASNVHPLPSLGQSYTSAQPQRIKVPSPITDVADPRLDPYRPDESVVKDYISRKMLNGKTDIEFLLELWESRTNVMLVGDTQAGKTMLVRVMAVAAGYAMGLGKPLPVFTLSGSSGVTDFDMFGQPTSYIDPEDGIERLVYLPGLVDLATRAGGILYLDEANMMGERVTSSLHPLTDDRRSFVNRSKAVVAIDEEGGETFLPEQVEANDNLWVVGTINPGYRGAGALNEAFLNRFQWLEWDYDENTERRLVPLSAVRLLGTALREARSARSIQTPVGTASLAALCRNVEAQGIDMGLWMFLSMFPRQEKPKVEAIIQDRSIKTLLQDEVRDTNNEVTV